MGGEATGADGSYFLSYSRNDERFALRLAKDLRARGVAMWIDQLDIRPSEHWDRAVERAVRSCRGLVVVLSPRSAESDNVADEISFALDSRKSVLPVMIERCTMPLRITRMQVIDATGDYAVALERCFDELTKDDAPAPAPEVAPRPPERTRLDAQLLAAAKAELAPFVGPIAAVLVKKASERASTPAQLYELLAEHIPTKCDRDTFLGSTKSAKQRPAPEPSKQPAKTQAKSRDPGGISSDELDRMSKIMTRFIGPIATCVVKRESHSSASLPELRGHLADLISDEEERAEFLRLAEGH
jgi:hypothetical protein